jgi:hypothetical protein
MLDRYRVLKKDLRIREFVLVNFQKPSTSRPPVPACPVLVEQRLLNKGKKKQIQFYSALECVASFVKTFCRRFTSCVIEREDLKI